MKDVIIVAGATHRAGMVDEYQRQVESAGIDFHLWALPPLPMGANSIHMQARIDYWRAVANYHKDYKTVYITDAWDVLFYGTKKELGIRSTDTMLISAERNCYPEPQLSGKITHHSPWRYANNGMIAANPHYLLDWLEKAEQIGDLGILDQAWFNRRLAENRTDFISLDYVTRLFYVVSATLEDGSLVGADGRPYNKMMGTSPCFLHFSGQTNPESTKIMLKESLVTA